MVTSFDVETFTPTHSLHLVQLCESADQTSGGIFLPEVMQSNWCEATVKRSGPGWLIPNSDEYALSWVHADARILFQQHHYRPLYRGARTGLVREEDILGVILEDTLHPLNNWVKVSIEDWVTGSDTIVVPEESQRRPRKGRVLDWGPGRLITEGSLIGCRLTIPTRLQISPREFSEATVHWGIDAEIVELGREGVECAFIEADDLDGIEESDE